MYNRWQNRKSKDHQDRLRVSQKCVLVVVMIGLVVLKDDNENRDRQLHQSDDSQQ